MHGHRSLSPPHVCRAAHQVPGEAAASLHLCLRTLFLPLFSLHLTRKVWLAELTQIQTSCSFRSQNHF